MKYGSLFLSASDAIVPVQSAWMSNNCEPHYCCALSIALGFIAVNDWLCSAPYTWLISFSWWPTMTCEPVTYILRCSMYCGRSNRYSRFVPIVWSKDSRRLEMRVGGTAAVRGVGFGRLFTYVSKSWSSCLTVGSSGRVMSCEASTKSALNWLQWELGHADVRWDWKWVVKVNY